MDEKESVGPKRRVVYISGCWDLFHVGHLWALQHADAMGDFLVVGCNTDRYMRSYKPDGPVVSYEQRCAILRALPCVDAVVPHDSFEDTTGFEEYGVNVRALGPEVGRFRPQSKGLPLDLERRVLAEQEQAGIKMCRFGWAPDEVSTTKIKEKVRCLLTKQELLSQLS